LIAYRIAANAVDLVKIREKAIRWDMEMTEARRTLDWEKQLSLSIDPEKSKEIHFRHSLQHAGNNVPCTMCGGSMCVHNAATTKKIHHPKRRHHLISFSY
jgi:phosphomethylpyrimidine synthase